MVNETGPREANSTAAVASPQSPKSALLKRFARKVARGFYRMLKPVLRPVAFRVRAYFTAGISEQLGHIRQQLAQESLAAARPVYQQELSAALHQAIQASRESIREEVLRSHAELIEQLKRVSGDMREAQVLANDVYIADMVARLDRIELLGNICARRVAIHSDNGTVLVRTEVGYVLCSDSDHALLASLLDTGELERGTRLLIQRFLGPGDVFVDVGANIGMMSLAAARAMQGNGKIFAFEPFPQTRGMLEKSFWINGFANILEVHGAAVSNRVGEAPLFLGATSGHHSMFALDIPQGYSAHQVDVPVVTLDGALPHGQDVTLLKIDVEGAEIDVIKGAASLHANNPDIAMIVEFGPSHLKRVGHTHDAWLETFTERGFVYRAINLNTGALEDVSRELLVSTESTNLFFARPSSSAWRKLGLTL